MKAYRTVSLEALSAIAGLMPIDHAISLYTDIRAISRGLPTNAVIAQPKKTETPIKTRGIHPTDSHIQVDMTGGEDTAEVSIYTDRSKTEHHVGAGMVAVKNSREVHIETQRLNIECTVFQAELCGIGMAVDWIQNQRKGTSSYAIRVDSKAALLAITNKHSTHPLATDTRRKIIELRTTTTITFHSIKGHTGLKGDKRADYLAKTVMSYNSNITYDAIPVSRGKQLLEDYYTQIWDATYINTRKASHTKSLIPSIFQRKSLPLWPNHILTQLLTNHDCFRSYLHKMKKVPTPLYSCPEKIKQMA
jgi:ribonuclease HI